MRSPRRRVKQEIREIVQWAEVHGWTLDEGKDGGGHWVLRQPGHAAIRLPDTPSERRGIANAKATIRRVSGLPNESGPAARYRHEPREERFSMDDALKEQRMRHALAEVEVRRRLRNAP